MNQPINQQCSLLGTGSSVCPEFLYKFKRYENSQKWLKPIFREKSGLAQISSFSIILKKSRLLPYIDFHCKPISFSNFYFFRQSSKIIVRLVGNLQNRFHDGSVTCRWLTIASVSHRATSLSGNIKCRMHKELCVWQ